MFTCVDFMMPSESSSLIINPCHQYFLFKFEDGSFDVGNVSVFANYPAEQISAEEEYILNWPNQQLESSRQTNKKGRQSKAKCSRLAATIICSSDDKLWLTQKASSLAAAREINGSTKNPSSSFDEAETDAVTPEPTRKSHRAVSQTEKAKQLQQDKKEKAAVDIAEKERLALKAEKKKKKADRSQLANEILNKVTSPSSSVAVASSSSVAVGDDNQISNSSQDYENIMLKIKENILKSSSAASTISTKSEDVLKLEERVATLEKEMIEFRRNHFNHPLAVSDSTPYVSGYSSYDWGSAAPSTSQHADDPHPTTNFFGETNSNFGSSQQLLEQNRKNDDSSSNFMPQFPTTGNKKLEHDVDHSYLNQQRPINTSQSELIASGFGTNSPKNPLIYNYLGENHSNYGSYQQQHASSRRLDEAQSSLTFLSSLSKSPINSLDTAELTNAAECSGDPGSSHPSTMLDLTNSSRQNTSIPMRELNFQSNNGQRKTPTIEYYNHASGEMIPLASGSMEKGKSLLSSGSTENMNSRSSIKDIQKSTSFSSNEENVPSQFPICMDIAKTIYKRVGRKMSLFTSKLMDFLFSAAYLMNHRLTDNLMNSDKKVADKQQISQLINCVTSFFPEEKESAIRAVIRQKFNNACKTPQRATSAKKQIK